MSDYDISVLVPAYNAEENLKQCIDSILAQTKDRIEIVIVDDGSTDSTGQIADDYRKQNSNVVVVHQENQGLTGARISALKHASGEYIGWVDADDFLEPEMYSILYGLAKPNDADIVYCDYTFYPEKVAYKDKWYKPYKGVKDWDFIDRNTQSWNKIFKKSFADETGLADQYLKFGEYGPIALMLRADKIISCDRRMYNYRVGHESMSGGTYNNKVAHFVKGCKTSSKLFKILEGTGYETELKDYFEYRYIYTLLQLQVVAALNNDEKAYRYASKKLRKLGYNSNRYTKLILDNNHGRLKSFVLRRVIPCDYNIAQLITKRVYG